MSPIGLITLALLCAGAAYSVYRPRFAIVLILLSFPIEQILTAESAVFVQRSWILNVAIALVAIVAIASYTVRGYSPFRGLITPGSLCIGALYAQVVLSAVLITPSGDTAQDYIVRGAPYWGLFLILLPMLVRNVDDMRAVILPIIFFGSLLIALFIASPHSEFYAGRFVMTYRAGFDQEFQNPLATASAAGLIAVAGMLYRPARAGTVVLLIRGGAVVAGLSFALMSGSRGQFLAAIFCTLLLFPVARSIKRPGAFLGALLGGTVFLGIFAFVARRLLQGDAGGRWDAANLREGFGGRTQSWFDMLGALLDNPGNALFGLGTASFDEYSTVELGYPHNLVIEILTEHGLIGLGLFAAAIIYAYLAFKLLRARTRADPSRLSVTAVLTAFCAFQLIVSLKQGSFVLLPEPFFFLMVLYKLSAIEQTAAVPAQLVAKAEPATTDPSHAPGNWSESLVHARSTEIANWSESA